VVLLDVGGFWAPLFDWIQSAVASGFVRDSHRMLAQRAVTVDDAIALATSPVPQVGHKWLDRDPTPVPGTVRA
jgi:predicted Rossmann-fold nucleotide-binding protein